MVNNKKEQVILNKFIKQHKIKEYSTEFAVGHTSARKHLGIGMSDNWRKYISWIKKIDLLVSTPEELTIYEIKERMNAKALGQLLVYQHLYSEDTGIPKKSIKLGLVCKHSDPQIQPLFDGRKIKVYVVK